MESAYTTFFFNAFIQIHVILSCDLKCVAMKSIERGALEEFMIATKFGILGRVVILIST